MSKILKIILALVVVVIASVILAIEPIAKWAIESEGSKAVGAKVNVDSVDIQFYPTHVALNNLTVANPKEPMNNLVESEKVSADVDIATLIKRQFVVDQVLLSGLQVNTARSTPGTLDGSMPPPKPVQEKPGLPSINLPNPKAMMDEEQAAIQAEIDEIQTGFKTIEGRWKGKEQELPKQAKLDEFKLRWEELKKKSTFERIAGTKQLRDDIKAELKKFDNWKSQLSTDIAEAKALSVRAAKLPGDQSQRIISKYGFDQGTEGFIKFLVGDEANALVQRGLTMYKETMGMLAAQESEPAPAEPEASSELPVKLLIREILIDGYQVIGGEKLAYSGKVNDVTDQQAYWDKPITMALQGGIQNQKQLLIDGIFDQRSEVMKSAFNMGLKQLALAGVPLSQNPSLPLQLEKGVADIAANFKLDGDALSGKVSGLIQQASLLVTNLAADSTNTTLKRLAEALKGVNKLVMDLNVGGSVDDPIIGLKSNLDRILGDVLGEEFKGQLKDAETKLKADLQSKYSKEIAQLESGKNILNDYSKLLNDREAAMQALMNELITRL
ncbi:TIGR03545 family protein [Spongiibacter sp. KMU-158]|uniref:TIGR03545 family protein n=1 Tax=Spongiibacter pelagi TaxID=2760804 RepID=A0A927BXK6_9GAMM|nr:TIGR03545 family protein [Spongiibacter pelagi]MBD2857400.1 TIGR03545 family protein [Spongiibacter pelagi]